MRTTRRGFLGAAGAATLFGFLGLDLRPAAASAKTRALRVKTSRIQTTICPYCAVGCGLLALTEPSSSGPRLVAVEGDPDHPISEGRLCPKGATLGEMVLSPRRLQKVLYRAPGADSFEEKDWDWAAERIARRIKDTRDADFEESNAAGQRVRRVGTMASLGSAALDNEECWLYQAFLRALGIVYIEHQARI